MGVCSQKAIIKASVVTKLLLFAQQNDHACTHISPKPDVERVHQVWFDSVWVISSWNS